MDITEKKGMLSANALKFIAVVAMFIDHVGWAFADTFSPVGQLMHFIGRFTAPLMCYFITEGYYHTKNLANYKKRLLIFALISHFPFVIDSVLTKPPLYFSEGSLTINTELFIPLTSVILPLFLGLSALDLLKSDKKSSVKVISLIGIILLSCLGDWLFFAVLWIIGFGMNRGNLKKQFIWYYAVALFEMLIFFIPVLTGVMDISGVIWQFGVLVPPLLILFYNGKKGRGGKVFQYFFYWFYPVHLLVIGLLKWYVFI